MNEKGLFYDRFASEFDRKMNMYDTEKRVRVVFESLLGKGEIKGKKLLDAGCGTGWFSARAAELGAAVTSLDVGENLLKEVRKKCVSTRVVGDVTALEFGDGSFDVIVSSDVIEHTPDPARAISEMARVLKKGGVLALTVPNSRWHFAVSVGNALKLRPYQGYENWVGWGQLERELEKNGLVVERQLGFHFVPFVMKALYPLIDYFDRYGETLLGRFMVNIGVRARKK
ncbi:demethylmenaquinone methyltransferase / 2-methoxy-6-polyprenyl-1,4-benzoquinol methylase [uncultured bacterium]|nr:demethylmenaquinone methyltransferase / 2-methoxy-6-polyprenyl-1,4-benzoquinol methylase [uncultured bacterium]